MIWLIDYDDTMSVCVYLILSFCFSLFESVPIFIFKRGRPDCGFVRVGYTRGTFFLCRVFY